MHLKFSQDIETLLQRLADRPLTISAILAETSERGFSLAIGLLTLPFLLPMPPGTGTILGAVCFLLALQMAMGKHKPWLPRAIANFKFPKEIAIGLLKNLKRLTKRLEKITRPRLLKLAQNRYVWRLNGLWIAWLAFLLALPIPMTNPLPTVAILLLAIATLEADGLLMCVAYVWGIAVTIFFGFLGYSILQAPGLILENLSLSHFLN
ncbi:MAG TPA: exopolysaccharide biosynthesis protein [Oscillatoriales cyanobacterium M59_W2019_021]|nr:MAG: exopolysaccharide biosynthesis protein [Cyanobacteria bacterium J055]HIK33470.1 exopolysaccharide biosynthesis protein [Oscillatoriales cyanobacterium M4454_W2019_049]HIK51583.1 exopolysaccharide biosynthesis protein [Oscillatoriales cyanobacterium M59_W2019_021]